MRRHVKSHSDERPIKCSQCLKAFKRNEHLARHCIFVIRVEKKLIVIIVRRHSYPNICSRNMDSSNILLMYIEFRMTTKTLLGYKKTLPMILLEIRVPQIGILSQIHRCSSQTCCANISTISWSRSLKFRQNQDWL